MESEFLWHEDLNISKNSFLGIVLIFREINLTFIKIHI